MIDMTDMNKDELKLRLVESKDIIGVLEKKIVELKNRVTKLEAVVEAIINCLKEVWGKNSGGD